MLFITYLRILGAKTSQTLDPYISKTRKFLESIIEQKLLRIMFLTIMFSQTALLGSYGFGP